jgi:hypothetical protein
MNLNKIAAQVAGTVTTAGLIKPGMDGLVQTRDVLKALGLEPDQTKTFTMSGASVIIPLKDGKKLILTVE